MSKEPTYKLGEPIKDWQKFKQERLAELDRQKVDVAVKMLRQELREALPGLRDRIEENPINWLGGRKDAPCPCTTVVYKATEWRPEKPVGVALKNCFMCGGTGKGEPPLHHGWGTAIRNLLREKGYGEEYFDVWNLDDYYAQLVELAVAMEYGLCLDYPGVIPQCTEITTSVTDAGNPPVTSTKIRTGVGRVWTFISTHISRILPKKNGKK